jgi:hypothetical protein
MYWTGETLTREEVYELVWSEPMRVVAPRLGLSDRGLAKACERLKIPRPGRGYWEKKRRGRTVRRPPLRPLPSGHHGLRVVPVRKKAAATMTSPAVLAQKALEADAPIAVPEKVERYHRLVREARAALTGRGKAKGRAPADPDCLTIAASRTALPRALRIMDTLIKALEQREYPVRTGRDGTVVHVRGVDIRIGLEERTRRKEVRHRSWGGYATYEFEPTGQFTLRILSHTVGGVRQSWSDGKRQRLEDCLNNFIVGLVAAAETRRRADEERRACEPARAEEELLEGTRRLLIERERNRIQTLARWTEEWQRGIAMRSYLDAVRTSAGETSDQDLQSWIDWAKGYLSELPVVPAVGDLLAQETKAPEELVARVRGRWGEAIHRGEEGVAG